jgi:hypothetical protein
MTSRKKPGVAFWATVVLVVALAYPLRKAAKRSETIYRVLLWYSHLCEPNSGEP